MNYMRLFSIIFLFLMMALFNNCSKTITENNYYNIVAADSLSSPNIPLKVVFTNPLNGAIGPFDNTDPTQVPPGPRITVQFSKLVNIYDIKENDIYLEYGEKKVPISLLNKANSEDFLTNILIFTVRSKYLAGEKYTLVIDTTFTDIHGYKLDTPHIVSFIPEPKFRVFHVYPSSDNVEPQSYYPDGYSRFEISFNSKIDTTIFNRFTISPNIKGYWALNFRDYYSDSTTARFFLLDTLRYNTTYTVSVSSQARDVHGMLINHPYQFSFTTAPFSVRLSGYSGYDAPGGFEAYNNFDFYFNAPVDTSTVKSSITVSPAISFNVKFGYRTNGQYKRIEIVLDGWGFKRNTTYTITLNPTIRSIYGDYLSKPYSFSFTTGN